MTSPKPKRKANRLRLGLLAALAVLAFVAVPVAVLAQDAPLPGAGAAEVAVRDKTLLDMFNQGGWLMYPLLLCSIGTAAVAVYCFIQISGKKLIPAAQVAAVGNDLEQRDAASAYALCQGNPNVFSNTLSAALLKVNFDRDLANKTSMEQAAAETLANEETKLMLWVNYLNVFATIAPMLGLLGTVTGMIQSFDSLAAGKSEPADLAGGIGEAMLTTAAGLLVGIPAMFLFFYFRNSLTIIITNVQRRVTFMIDVLSGELKLEGAKTEYEAAPEQA
jgi:biopolymer transport protein ExbB